MNARMESPVKTKICPVVTGVDVPQLAGLQIGQQGEEDQHAGAERDDDDLPAVCLVAHGRASKLSNDAIY